MKHLMDTELKRIFNRKSFVIAYIVFILISIVYISTYKDNFDMNYKCTISVINNDNSEKSKIFIDTLEENDTIKITKHENSELDLVKEMIKDSKVNACIIIPKNFFENLPNSKMDLIYADKDVIAPALIDIISQAFIVDVTEKVLYDNVNKQYGKKEADESIIAYNKLKSDDSFNLEIIKESYNDLRGLNDKVSINKINSIRAIFMYILSFNLLFVALSLQNIKKHANKLIVRMRIANNAHKSYHIAQSILHAAFFLITPIIISILSAIQLDMKFLPFLYFLLSSVVISLFIYELINILTSIFKDDNLSFSFSVVCIIFLSIFGGAFFSLDIMPKAFIAIASKSPFYVLSDSFYGALNSNFSSFSNVIIYLILTIALYSDTYRIKLKK